MSNFTHIVKNMNLSSVQILVTSHSSEPSIAVTFLFTGEHEIVPEKGSIMSLIPCDSNAHSKSNSTEGHCSVVL